MEETRIEVFGLTVTIYRPTDDHDVLRARVSTAADVTVFFLGDVLSRAVAEEIPELPPVTDAPHRVGLSVHQVRGRDGSCWRLWFGDGTACCDYVFSADLRTIWVRWNTQCNSEQVTQLLLDTVLAWTARFQGKLCLHASVTALAGRAIAIVAPSGSGKSTLAAALASWHGGSVLSDDTAALTAHTDHGCGHIVHPGRSHIRMSEASLTAIAYDGNLTTTYDDKYHIPLADTHTDRALRFEATAQPLRAVYLLRRDPGATQPMITACSLADAAGALTANLYPAQFPRDQHRSISEHIGIVEVLRHTPCRMLIIPDRFSALPSVCKAITHDVTAIRAAVVVTSDRHGPHYPAIA